MGAHQWKWIAAVILQIYVIQSWNKSFLDVGAVSIRNPGANKNPGDHDPLERRDGHNNDDKDDIDRKSPGANEDESSATHVLIGSYKLVEVSDFEGNSLDIPGDYILEITSEQATAFGSKSSSTDTNLETFTFRLNIKIGNMIGGKLTVDMPASRIDHMNNAQIYHAQVSSLFQTKIMVPPELSLVEEGLDSILPGVESIALYRNTLTFHGTQGVVAFHARTLLV